LPKTIRLPLSKTGTYIFHSASISESFAAASATDTTRDNAGVKATHTALYLHSPAIFVINLVRQDL
jgi:hypothetical protein